MHTHSGHTPASRRAHTHTPPASPQMNASTLLMDNSDIALATVQQNGWALQYASERIKNNKEVVLAAVQQNGWAVEYASEHLKDDATVFKAATKAVLNKLGASAEADEADAVRAMSFAFLARVFKHNDKFVEEARAASAAFEHPGEKDLRLRGV